MAAAGGGGRTSEGANMQGRESFPVRMRSAWAWAIAAVFLCAPLFAADAAAQRTFDTPQQAADALIAAAAAEDVPARRGRTS